MGKPLELDIPERHKPAKGAFSIRPKKVDHWLNELPKANLGETARLIYSALLETNHAIYSYQDRMRFLETMREPVQYVTDSLKKHFIGVSYPLPTKNQKIAAAAREILAAMATGYKIAISDMLDGAFLFADKKLLSILLHRAISYTGRTLLTSYQIYAPCTPNLWHELHKLYTIAEERKLARNTVADYQHIYVEKTSISAEYSRILLLALTSPYRLRQGEASKVYATLERWTQYCQLSPMAEVSNQGESFFGVVLNKDAPPRASSHLAPDQCDNNQCRILNTESLAQIIRKEIQDTEDMGNTTISGVELARPELSHDLLRRLLVAWGVETKRSFSRTNKHEKVEVCIGLSAIHKFIGKRVRQNEREDIYTHQAQFESTVVESASDEKPDIWNMVYPTEVHGIRPLVEEEINLSNRAQGEQSPASPTYTEGTWAIINESAGGYCLEYRKGANAKAQVGELVGIRRSSGQNWKWGIGVIRWMKFSSTRTLRLGIEMLNPDAAAVGIRSVNTNKKEATYQRILMLPEIQTISQPATLVMPPAPWRVGNQIYINILGKELHVVLSAIEQSTGLFTQFQFKLVETDQPEDTQDTSGLWETDKDFTKIWSSI